MKRRIIEIKELGKTYYQPQYKFMFWWIKYKDYEFDGEGWIKINRKYVNIGEAIAFVEDLRFNKEKKVAYYWEN